MLARLILSLLLAAFALPAMAASPCHDAPMAMPASHHAMPGMPGHEDKAVMAHDCIGCVPPSSITPRAIAHPPVAARVPLIAAIASFDVGETPAPITPPPRREG